MRQHIPTERSFKLKRSVAKVALTLLFLLFTSKSFAGEVDIPPFFPELPDKKDIEKVIPLLEKGTIVIIQREEGKPPFITGIVLINAPRDEVMKLTTAYEKYPEFVPNAKEIKVLLRFPETNTQITEYNVAFNVAFGIKFTVSWTLEQHINWEEGIIWGIPAKKGKQVFSDVRYIEKYYDFGDKTVMLYSAFADLSSFGVLSKLIYSAFPELQIPSLVAIATLFPEAVKQKISGRKIIVEPKKIDPKKVKIPPRLDISPLLPLLEKYGQVILSWYPNEQDIRFFSAFVLTEKSPSYVRRVLSNPKLWHKIFPIIEKVKVKRISEDTWKARFSVKYKVALPIKLKYTLIYKRVSPTRIIYFIDPKSKSDISGEWGAWDIWKVGNWTVVGVTSFTDLRSGSLFLRILFDKIEGFGIGLRVAVISTMAQGLEKIL